MPDRMGRADRADHTDRSERSASSDRPLRVAILARSVYPLHGVGGLERHVYDLVRHLIARGMHVMLITKPPNVAIASAATADGNDDADGDATAHDGAGRGGAHDEASARAAEWFGVPPDRLRLVTVPYITFPGAGRRGTTVADRITAYPFFGWRAGRVAAKFAYCDEVDIVYALGASGLGYALARRRHEATKAFVFNPQGLEEFGATNPERARLKTIAYGPLQSAVRSCARAADAVIATDHALVPTVLHHLPIDADRVVVIPNAIDVEAIDRRRGHGAGDALRARLQIPRDAPLLLSVGRLEANKGFHVLAHALGLLLQQQQRQPQQQRQQQPHEQTAGEVASSTLAGGSTGPAHATAHGTARAPVQAAAHAMATALARRPDAWRWALIGDGPFRPAIERVAETAGLASRMIIAGRVHDDELHAWYEAADLFVHPTLYEGSSLVTLEAMAHGRPIVATRAGGLPDKVTPGDNGWLVDPDRPDQLAEAVSQALHLPPAALAAMGHASRARVERDFAWPVIAGRMIDLYRRLIAAEERS